MSQKQKQSAAQKVRITLTVMGRPVSMMIDPGLEEFYRRANKDVNEAISSYNGIYSKTTGNDTIDVLIRVCLNFAIQNVFSSQRTDAQSIRNYLKELQNDLSNYLNDRHDSD
ncbi:MAG: cell division protein ZapA [Paludibacteraceae bacterium]|jgi:cell division protein ZapA (FtsZ GTPase activity inhibitor)|nr:cell division protein ZapA [Paludibacteraceae bacterium]MCR5298522.1 cell division protein ZapA [Paludibacteraceae bacterium]